jgi:NAD-dependent dihydropyrimidine dehydrogenase PreA subunit
MTNLKEELRERDIIEIDEDLCDGCGRCVVNCAEGALAIIDGKARLVSDLYCDGLGACLGHCPTGALRIIRRKSLEFDEALAKKVVKSKGSDMVCKGSMVRKLTLRPKAPSLSAHDLSSLDQGSALEGIVNWPLKIRLVPPSAPFLNSEVLIVSADCVGFASLDFRRLFLSSGFPLMVGCPKLDDADLFIVKFGEILKNNPAIKEIRVPIMNVPCCRGLIHAVVRGITLSGREDTLARLFVTEDNGSIREEFPS